MACCAVQTTEALAGVFDEEQISGYQEEVQLREQDFGNFQVRAPAQLSQLASAFGNSRCCSCCSPAYHCMQRQQRNDEPQLVGCGCAGLPLCHLPMFWRLLDWGGTALGWATSH